MENEKQIEDIVNILDAFAASDDRARMKIKMSDELEEGAVKREYHYGRCDIGSAFCKGTPFDLDGIDRIK